MSESAATVLDREGDVFILRLQSGENRFSPAALASIEEALGEVEGTEGPRALVTTGAGKYFSNGLDVDHMSADPEGMDSYLARVDAVFARLLSLPCPTVAAVNGHAFGAGAMLALSHDLSVMRADRGWWCLPEVDLAMYFPAGMNALCAARMPIRTAHEAMVTGRRYTGAEALGAGIVEAVADEEQLLAEAVVRATALASKAGASIARIRTTLHAEVLAHLTRSP